MKYNLEHCIGKKLRSMSRIVDTQFRSSFKDFNITENQATLLFVLKGEGKIDQGILGKKLGLERSSISRNINILVKSGYVDKSFEYRPEVFLTKKGNELIKQLIPLWEGVMDKIILEIGNEGVQMINNLEKKLM